MSLSGLNDPQKQAVLHTYGPLMILAGAGTGKTRVITTRIARIVEQGYDPASIIAVTFTNKAAREMKERLFQLIGSRAKKVFVGTFHRLGIHLLRKHGHHIDLAPNFRLIGHSDQVDVMRRALQECGLNGLLDPVLVHAQVSRWKNDNICSEIATQMRVSQEKRSDHENIVHAYATYEAQLRLHGTLDFDDCLMQALRLVQERPEVLEQVSKTNSFLLVDEFQDTNAVQLELIATLGSSHKNVCVVGDDDQSIYSWRGAMYEVLERFEQRFPDTRLIKLEQNYRSTNLILQSANGLIGNNSQRKSKSLWSSQSESEPIRLRCFLKDSEEASWIAEQCMTHLGRGESPGEICILARTAMQLKTIELSLKEAGLRYKMFGGQSIFDRKELKDLISYLTLILNHQDRLALYRIINTPQRGIGVKTLEIVDSLAKRFKKSPFDALTSPLLENVSPKAKHAMQQFAASIRDLKPKDWKEPKAIRNLAHKVLERFRFAEEVKSRIKTPQSQINRIDAMRSLPDWLQSVADHLFEEDPDASVGDFLTKLSLEESTRNENEDQNDQLSLMTMHAAKGLEFQVVFIAGLNEGLLPHKNSLGDDTAISEERRLCYVALTRAKKHLYLSYFQTKGGEKSRKQSFTPSRFLDEIPKECLLKPEDEHREAKKCLERRKHTLATLSALKSQLL